MQSLSRALTVLEEIARQDTPQTLTELTEVVGLHKSTVYRMLATFVSHGVVRRDESNRYHLGLGVFGVVGRATAGADRWAALDDVAAELAIESGALVNYAAPKAGRLETAVTYSPQGERVTAVSQLPWHASAAAKAYLAARPRTEIQRVIGRNPLPAYTAQTMTDPFLVMQTLNRVREHGYAIEDRERSSNLRALGAAVVDRTGEATAALELQMPIRPHSPQMFQRFTTQIRQAAQELSDRLDDAGNGSYPPTATVRA